MSRPAPAQPDYYTTLPTGKMQMFLFADYSDRAASADLFRPFVMKQPAFGFDEPRLFDAVRRAASEIDPEKQASLYEALVMQSLPVVPIAHVKTAFALSPRLRGFRVDRAPSIRTAPL